MSEHKDAKYFTRTLRFHQNEIELICDRLIEYDSGIVEIVQFGSDLARDLDVRGNFLLRYTYQPGSDLYIVYNELWQSGDVERRSIVAKLTYFLNL